MKRASINFTNKILRWYKEQLSFTMIGNLEMSWQWESKVKRIQNIESNHYRGLYRMDYNSDPIQKYRVYATVNYMLRIIMIENSLLSCWKYCRSLLLCSDDMIQFLYDEYNKTFNEIYGLLITGSGQIVCCLIIFQANQCICSNCLFCEWSY